MKFCSPTLFSVFSFAFMFTSTYAFRALRIGATSSRFGSVAVANAPRFVLRNFANTANDDPNTVVARCTKKISDMLKPAKILVTSTNDDPNGSHIQIECIAEEFEGKNRVQRQKMVYKAIWEELEGPVHAVDSIVAKTPKEVGM